MYIHVFCRADEIIFTCPTETSQFLLFDSVDPDHGSAVDLQMDSETGGARVALVVGGLHQLASVVL